MHPIQEHAIWQSNAAFLGRVSDPQFHASLGSGYGIGTSSSVDIHSSVGPALNTNGKPRARRGSATDPQSVYARVSIPRPWLISNNAKHRVHFHWREVRRFWNLRENHQRDGRRYMWTFSFSWRSKTPFSKHFMKTGNASKTPSCTHACSYFSTAASSIRMLNYQLRTTSPEMGSRALSSITNQM